MLAFLGCGGGDAGPGGDGGTNGATIATAATAGSPTSAGVPATDAGPAATEPAATQPPVTAEPDDQAALAAIRSAFETFFDGAGSDLDARLAVLQDGESYRDMLADASENEQFQSLSTTINEIKLLSADDCAARGASVPCAMVTHDLLVGGMPALIGQQSLAVFIGDEWLVASSAWCAVVAIGGEDCP
jgi:hypothetical protein